MDREQIEQELDSFENVSYRMRNEGLSYCFKKYSSFREVEDEEFHRLRNEFLTSMKNIEEYVENKIEELREELDNYEEF